MAKIIIIGNSAAGFSACETLVKSGFGNEITVITKESFCPYRKDRLFDYLAGNIKEKELFLCKEDFYQSNNVSFLKGATVIKVDTKKQRIILKDNSRMDYDYLIIASGESVKLPDASGVHKDGVFSLSSLEEIKQIITRLMVTNTVGIVGAGPFVSMFCEILLAKNIDVKVIGKTAGFLSIQNEKLELISDVDIAEFIGEAELKAVKLTNGKIIGMPLVIFTGNFKPDTEFLAESDLTLLEGFVVVDENMRSSIENIFACTAAARKADREKSEKTFEQEKEEGARTGENILKALQLIPVKA